MLTVAGFIFAYSLISVIRNPELWRLPSSTKRNPPAMGSSVQSLTLSILLLLLLSGRAQAFGAGNIASISQVEGQNWRHGDIEDTLLTLFLARAAGGRKFGKLDVQRVYFGNWLRDYSQAVDVGTLKYVSAEAIRILIWVLGFLSFG